jgi:hypothetical protein
MLKKTLFVSCFAALSLMSAQAFAGECDDSQQAEAGMIAAGLGKTTVSKVVPVTGKQMVNVTECEFAGGKYSIQFKYNFLAADGLYWIEASSKFSSGGAGSSVRVIKTSPNMAAAEAKAGVKLASN